MITFKDDFLEPEYFKELQTELLSDTFPWFYNDYRTSVGDEDLQFVHCFYDKGLIKSSYGDMFYPLIKKIGANALVKIKANMTLKGTKVSESYHTDVPFNCNTGILYINTTNGKTRFENGFEVDGIENRFVTFNSQLKHTGLEHTDTKRRIVLNINYF